MNYPTYSFIGIAGGRDVAGGNVSAVLGGYANQACDTDDAIAGGYDNIIGSSGDGGAAAQTSFVGAGQMNGISAYNAFIGAGATNAVTATDGFVGAGGANAANGFESFVGAGSGNTAANSQLGGSGEPAQRARQAGSVESRALSWNPIDSSRAGTFDPKHTAAGDRVAETGSE